MKPRPATLIRAACALLLPAACTPLAQRAANGDADAQFRYGRQLLLQKKAPGDAARAIIWLEHAASQRHPNATAALGLCHERGLGTAPNRDQARHWYSQAADLGHVGAAFALSDMALKDGDAAQAARCLEPLCTRRHLPAELHLAVLFMSKKSPHYAPEKAIRYLRYAAMDGSAEAAHMLSRCYAQGLGVPKNAALARGWEENAREAPIKSTASFFRKAVK